MMAGQHQNVVCYNSGTHWATNTHKYCECLYVSDAKLASAVSKFIKLTTTRDNASMDSTRHKRERRRG